MPSSITLQLRVNNYFPSYGEYNIVTAVTAGQNNLTSFFRHLTVDHADFLGFDH